jgi:catechol 2,3-dioxygenase-like lactoylglutathione lyase family enzyme
MGMQITKAAIDLGIVTTNGPAMLAFYKDLLGLRPAGEMPMPGGVGVMHRLLCGDSLIKLVVLPAVPAAAAPGGIQGASGYRYWTITIANLAEMVAACQAAGARVVMAEKEIRPGIRIAIVADPDGNWVEFLALA